MIPEKAYKLAESAGWTPANMLHTGNYIADTKFHDCTTALDPLFWQALGKALYWWEGDEIPPVQPLNHWRATAHRFYDLILTGQDTEQFWHDIINI